MSDKRIVLIAGLGNPGDKYEKTRHNAGFLVVDGLSHSFSIPLVKNKFDLVFGRGTMEGVDVILAKPMAYMNRSGPPIKKLADYYGIKCEDLFIIYDDIDLTFERIRIKEKGGHGGHNGIRSLIDAFGTNDFPRLRLGIGRPGSSTDVTGHVLGRFTVEEAEIFTRMVDCAGKAVVAVLKDGLTVAMNNFNCLR
ncbi:MAG: aminoacyl-tRNA hydrolase [Proteobacteria bacterium]|nr:aminoacyl-tRNA hydrolase [Pseudomonadota bacterium]